MHTRHPSCFGAAVAVSSAAMAQVTISGQIAGGSDKVGSAATTIGFQDTTLTFRATEDLGNGITASGAFTIENMTSRGNRVTDVPRGPTNADTSMALASPAFGTVSLANTRSGDQAVAANVMGISLAANAYNTNNHNVFSTRPNVQILGYTTPELIKGLRISAAQAAITDNQAAKINVLSASYANGPLAIGVVSKSRNAAATAAGSEKSTMEASAAVDFGVARVGLGYSSKALTTGKAATTFGVRVPMGAIAVGLNMGKRGAAEYMDMGATYSLSKRTNVAVASGTYKTNTATTDTRQTRVRVEHNF